MESLVDLCCFHIKRYLNRFFSVRALRDQVDLLPEELREKLAQISSRRQYVVMLRNRYCYQGDDRLGIIIKRCGASYGLLSTRFVQPNIIASLPVPLIKGDQFSVDIWYRCNGDASEGQLSWTPLPGYTRCNLSKYQADYYIQIEYGY